MSFYLRVEGVNLGHFVNDTNNLSTTRGGSLLLLEAVEDVEKIVVKNTPEIISPEQLKLSTLENQLNQLKTIPDPTKSEKNKKKNLREQIRNVKQKSQTIDEQPSTPTITKGASWGLFNLDVSSEEACAIYTRVVNLFKTHSHYKHATFVVNLHENNGYENYQADRDKLQTLNRWQQMQAPSLAICASGITSCTIDKTRPAIKQQYLPDQQKEFVSESVYQRKTYGIKQKQAFYYKRTNLKADYTQDINTLSLSTNSDKGILEGKIAFIYIDGNGFGNIQKNCNTPEQQKAFDIDTRQGRERLLANILEKIHDDQNWLTADDRIRLETLLWGGDELIWVVPAWKGWWMINEFYKQARLHIKHDNKPLFHAAGLVFCHHNAPIHRIDTLARNLADQFAKQHRNKNLIAYQILESFDHAGTQIASFRQERIQHLGQPGQLLIDAEKITAIQHSISALKDDEHFARRKIYQIVEAYRDENPVKATQYIAKLSGKSSQPLSDLEDIFGGDNVHWLHLMDLWDYMSDRK